MELRCGGLRERLKFFQCPHRASPAADRFSYLRSMLVIETGNAPCASRIERVGNFDDKRKRTLQVQWPSRNHPVMEKVPADHRAEILGLVVEQVNECRALGWRLGW
jgi:hypothetical protein